MDDIQERYAIREPIVYLGKVDSIKSYPGFNKVKLVWERSSDVRIENTIIYWNRGRDSIVKSFDPTKKGTNRNDSVVIENLRSGNNLFEFKNIDGKGGFSILTEKEEYIWDDDISHTLNGRIPLETDYDFSSLKFDIILSGTNKGDSIVYSEFKYKDNDEKEIVKLVNREINNVVLNQVPEGSEIKLRTVFYMPQGIDTIYGEERSIRVPMANHLKPLKLSLEGNSNSTYFEGKNSFYEWTINNELKEYILSYEPGEINEKSSYSNILNRNDYIGLVFYDEDRFIGVTNASFGGKVYMYTLSEGNMNIVSGDSFGTGFHIFDLIMSNGNYFYSRTRDGILQTWLANNDASWNDPNGGVRGEGFKDYDKLIVFNKKNLLGIDLKGRLYSYPIISDVGDLGEKTLLGSGWDKFERIVSINDNLICLMEDGTMLLYGNIDIEEPSFVVPDVPN